MYGLELVEANPDPLKSAVMSRAGELRSEGYDPGDALSMAWQEIEGDGADAGGDYDLMAESRPRRRPRASNPTEPDSGLGLILLLGLAGYLAWCFFTSSYKGLPWSWAPWKSISRRLPVARPTQQLTPATLYNSRDGYQPITLIVP